MRDLSGYASVMLLLSIFMVLSVGCGPAPTNAPLPTNTLPAPTNTPLPTDTPSLLTPQAESGLAADQEAGGFKPLASPDCKGLADVLEKALSVKPETAEAAFMDYISGQGGTGCQATVTGTGADFGELPAVASKLQKMLEEQGWTYLMEYQADGPSGTGMGFRKETGLCLLSVDWKPSADAKCPEDEPLASCKLKPEQKLFVIVLNCAQSAAQ